jgi:transposase InsO family protein
MDLIGPIPMSTNGFQWILTVVDVMTGFTLLKAMKSKTMEETAQKLLNIICEHGPPKIIQSDNGLEFVNSVISELTSLFGVDHRLITPYNPRADGLVERKNKEIGRGLKKRMKGATENWELLLPTIEIGLNNTILERTQSTPFELYYGRSFNGFTDWTNSVKSSDIEESLQQRVAKLEHLHSVVFPAISECTSEIRGKRNKKFNSFLIS